MLYVCLIYFYCFQPFLNVQNAWEINKICISIMHLLVILSTWILFPVNSWSEKWQLLLTAKLQFYKDNSIWWWSLLRWTIILPKKKMQVTHSAVLVDGHIHFLSLAFHSFHLNLSLLFCHLLNITTKFTPSEKGYIKIMYLWHAINNINSSLSSKWKVTSIKK